MKTLVQKGKIVMRNVVASLAALVMVVGCGTGIGDGQSATTGKLRTIPICHDGKSLELPPPAAQAHVDHGDLLGYCLVEMCLCRVIDGHLGPQEVCETLEVSENLVDAYLDRGATLGPCKEFVLVPALPVVPRR